MIKKLTAIFCLLCCASWLSASGPARSAEQVPQSVLDTLISFDAHEADLKGILEALAEAFDLNIVVGEDVQGTVSFSLTDVRLEDALDLILGTTSYSYRVQGNIIMILSAKQEVMTKVVKLNYVKASQIQTSLASLKTEDGEVAATEQDDRLVIKELPSRMKVLLDELKALDQPPQQVLIEARMIEVEDSDLTAFGLTWAGNVNLAGLHDDKGPLGTRTFTPPGASSTSTTSVSSADFGLNLSETSTDLSGGQFTQGFTFWRGQSSATIDALIRANKAELLASPSIATMDGEEAKIIIGEKFPFRENTLTAVGTTETTKFIDIGVALRVKPTVLEGDQMMIELHPEVSSLNQSLDAGPRIDTREANTKVLVTSGETIVIAGLIRHDKTVIRQKVPFLGNLPLVGLAFRNRSTDYVTRELAVFITPYLIPMLQPEKKGEITYDRHTPRIFYDRAVRLLEEFNVESLGRPEEERVKQAISILKSIARTYPYSEAADDALYMTGRLFSEKLGDAKQAAYYWDRLKIGYPDSPYLTPELLHGIKSSRKKAERMIEKRHRKLK